jgi:hypothetical protein
MHGVPHEIVVVGDGSNDGTWQNIGFARAGAYSLSRSE